MRYSNRACLVKVINRQNKTGLVPAILHGISSSAGEYILVMDADFSHSPEAIPRMIKELLQNPDHIIVASRYIKGGSVVGWTESKQTAAERKEAQVYIVFVQGRQIFHNRGKRFDGKLFGILPAVRWYIRKPVVCPSYGDWNNLPNNFFLNKWWTFEERNFSGINTLKQYGMFVGMSSIGAVLQLAILYLLVQSGGVKYEF